MSSKSSFDTEEGSSWDVVNEKDLWESGNFELDQEDYVLVRQEDIVDGIACFMAAYLLSLKQTKVCSLCFELFIFTHSTFTFLLSWEELSKVLFNSIALENQPEKALLLSLPEGFIPPSAVPCFYCHRP